MTYNKFRKNVFYKVILLFMFYNPDNSNAYIHIATRFEFMFYNCVIEYFVICPSVGYSVGFD